MRGRRRAQQDKRRRTFETSRAGFGHHYEVKKRRARTVRDPRLLQDDEYFEKVRLEAVRTAVERLPEKFRAALVLYAAGYSYVQITEITGEKVGTMRSRVCRGKTLLRRKLRAYYL